MSYMRRTAAASILFIALTACSLPARASAQEILWDAYGVPHIRGETLEEVSWAFGWAQAGDPDRPLTTPDGLSDDAAVVRALAEAANAVRAEHGRLDVAWGDEYRLRAPGLDLPANGMSDPFGVFRATGYTETEDGRHAARFGDSFVAAVEFGEAVRARALLTYGNATQPGLWSPAQMTLYAEKQLRPVLFTKDEVDANAVRKETFQAR